MSNLVIRCFGLALGGGPDGLFLVSYDPDANDGRGQVEWTDNVNRAMRFPDTISAFRFYRQTSKLRPTRADGKPNRPLTAFNIEVLRFDDV